MFLVGNRRSRHPASADVRQVRVQNCCSVIGLSPQGPSPFRSMSRACTLPLVPLLTNSSFQVDRLWLRTWRWPRGWWSFIEERDCILQWVNIFYNLVLQVTNKRSYVQGSPGISEITRGRSFFLSRPGHPPPPLLGQKRICQIYSEKNIYGFRIYYTWRTLCQHCVFIYALHRITTKHTC